MAVNIPNGRKIFQMFIKYSSFQGPPNFTKIGIFGLKTNHLATLILSDGAPPDRCGF
jgi:hypothetical protein